MPDNRTPQEVAVACLDCGSIMPRRGVYRQEALADLTAIIAGVPSAGTPVEAGKCPKCGGELTYPGGTDLNCDVLTYDVDCQKRGFAGEEVHAITFTHYWDTEEGDAIEEQQAA